MKTFLKALEHLLFTLLFIMIGAIFGAYYGLEAGIEAGKASVHVESGRGHSGNPGCNLPPKQKKDLDV